MLPCFVYVIFLISFNVWGPIKLSYEYFYHCCVFCRPKYLCTPTRLSLFCTMIFVHRNSKFLSYIQEHLAIPVILQSQDAPTTCRNQKNNYWFTVYTVQVIVSSFVNYWLNVRLWEYCTGWDSPFFCGTVSYIYMQYLRPISTLNVP